MGRRWPQVATDADAHSSSSRLLPLAVSASASATNAGNSTFRFLLDLSEPTAKFPPTFMALMCKLMRWRRKSTSPATASRCCTASRECCFSTSARKARKQRSGGLSAGLPQVFGAVNARRNSREPGGAGEAESWIELHDLFDDVDFLLTRVHHVARRSGGRDGTRPVAIGDARLAELA